MTSNKVPNIFGSTDNSTKEVFDYIVKSTNPASYHLDCALNYAFSIAPDFTPATMEDIRYQLNGVFDNANNTFEDFGEALNNIYCNFNTCPKDRGNFFDTKFSNGNNRRFKEIRYVAFKCSKIFISVKIAPSLANSSVQRVELFANCPQ